MSVLAWIGIVVGAVLLLLYLGFGVYQFSVLSYLVQIGSNLEDEPGEYLGGMPRLKRVRSLWFRLLLIPFWPLVLWYLSSDIDGPDDSGDSNDKEG